MNAPVPTRVLIADDDPLVRQAYRAFFSTQEAFTLVAEVRDGAEAVHSYALLKPDIVLMDLQMPVVAGIEATERICMRWPGACVVALTTFGTRDYIVAALKAGASGYLLKDSGADNLVAGMHQALRGDMPLSASVRRQLASSVTSQTGVTTTTAVGLTSRETELLRWLTQGMTNYQIGRAMYVSEGSVKQYLSHIGDKLGVKSRTQILVKAIRLNIVDPMASCADIRSAR